MFKKSFLKYRTKKANKLNSDARMSVKYGSAKKIGLIFTIDDIQKHHAIKKLIDDFKSDNKEVIAIAYLPSGKDNYEFLFDFFTNKEINFWGQLTNEKALSFLENEFDFIFNLDKKTNIYTRFLLANSNAKCRAGNFSEEDDALFEFMIKPTNSDINSLFSDLIRYIKKI